MVRAKSRLRRVLNVRFLRWWILKRLVLALPPLGSILAFFPRHVDLIDAADVVLRDTHGTIPVDDLMPDLAFLQRCLLHDGTAPKLSIPEDVVIGDRTVIIRAPWIDMTTGTILLPDRARSVLVRGEYANWNATSARPWRARQRIAGRVFVPVQTAHYYHLLVENGLRILDLLAVSGVRGRSLVLVTRPPVSAVEGALYAALASDCPELTIQTVAPPTLVMPDEAVQHWPRDTYWEWGRIGRAEADRLAAAFEVQYGSIPRVHGERLYLTRDGAKLRNPTNAAALRAALEAEGFQPFVASDANHAEQIARFRVARTIVAVHGAGLTNLLFARPGARVIEIFPDNLVKSTYWWMARRLGLDYQPVIGGIGDYHQHFEAPVAGVLKAVKGM